MVRTITVHGASTSPRRACFLTILLDGYDTAVISFTAPPSRMTGACRPPPSPGFRRNQPRRGDRYLSCGALAARFGHRRLVIASVGFFGLMSLATILATDITELTVFRFVTALGLAEPFRRDRAGIRPCGRTPAGTDSLHRYRCNRHRQHARWPDFGADSAPLGLAGPFVLAPCCPFCSSRAYRLAAGYGQQGWSRVAKGFVHARLRLSTMLLWRWPSCHSCSPTLSPIGFRCC